MEKINELVEMAQVISAVMDEAGVDSLQVSTGYFERTSFTMFPELFFKTFTGFKIEALKADMRFKFRLIKEIQGVEFTTFVDDLTGLKMVKFLQQDKVRINRHKKSLQARQCK